MHTRLTKLLSALLAGMSLCCCAPTARAGVFDPDVYGNGMSLNQYMREVPGGGQPGGPAYTFFMGKYEITNGQFAAFLNDAQLDGGATGKGSNMNFLNTGEVRLPGDGRTMFLPSGATSGIKYDLAAPIGQRYYVHANFAGMDYSYFPARRMSLLGAMKFCNWLTLDQGLGESERVYHEGPSEQDWHPMSINASDYLTRDINAAERQDLVDNYLGYRLPMEQQTTTGAPYNEFYKAAAWDTTSLVNHTYGFGRSTIDVQDANGDIIDFVADDPFETSQDVQTTPVGFYDGTNWQRSEWNWPLSMNTFQTRANLNSYGIYDLSGNVLEWMQDQFQDPSVWHSLRGGSNLYGSSGLTNTYREGAFPSANFNDAGMRVVRIPEPAAASLLLFACFYATFGRRRRKQF